MRSPTVDVQALHSAAATAEQGRRALAHLDYLMRTRPANWTVGGPAEAYRVIGSFAQIAAILQPNLCHLDDWLTGQHTRGRLVAEQGPFTDDTAAAIAVTNQALSEANQACIDLHAALERAHLATASITAPEAAQRRHPGRTIWNLVTRH